MTNNLLIYFQHKSSLTFRYMMKEQEVCKFFTFNDDRQ